MDALMIFSARCKMPPEASPSNINHLTRKSYTAVMVSPVSSQQCGSFGEGKSVMHKQLWSQRASSEVIPLCSKWGGSPSSHLQRGLSSSYLHGSADTLSALWNSSVSVQDRDIFWSNLPFPAWRPELLKEGLLAFVLPVFQKCNKCQSHTVKSVWILDCSVNLEPPPLNKAVIFH